ncbi:hypothetical protein C5167_003689 [Papaver somniferum]|uniref:Uncharacterized protein n=1 Tax=Papaver somniferum TaxID=3469 RepID=A0A4Y7L5N2_PAPSO|nr:hypothetical protein C5167_003689 [Papaver somniferum]
MLLSINIHNEKIQSIRFPADCTLSLVNEHQFIEVHQHLLEFKGYPCVAHSEKIMVSNRTRSNKYGKRGRLSRRVYSGTTIATSSTTTTAPTRMLSFSHQMLLYWFDGDMKHLKVVKCSSSCNKRNRGVFKLRMKRISAGRNIDQEDNSYCQDMDYQLHAQVENILSLKTFIPEEETKLVELLSEQASSVDRHCNGGGMLVVEVYLGTQITIS